MRGIAGYGIYLPWQRLERSAIAKSHSWYAPALMAHKNGTRAVTDWDEDSITLAVEAARQCLATNNSADVAEIRLASTSLPYNDRQNAGIIKEALVLSDEVRTLDVSGGRKAGLASLIEALHSDRSEDALCIAADTSTPKPMSEAEFTLGDGAAAFLLSKRQPIAELLASKTLSVDFVDNYVSAGDKDGYAWESRWIRDEGYLKFIPDVFKDLLDECSLDAASVSSVVFDTPMRGLHRKLAKALKLPSEKFVPSLIGRSGFVGTAHPLIQLAGVLETAKPGDKIVCVAFGQGCEMLLLQVTEQIVEYRSQSTLSSVLEGGHQTDNYLKYLTLAGRLDCDLGMRAEQDRKTPLTALYRDRKAAFGLVGGKCRKTGAVQFPKSDISVAENNWEVGTQDDYRLADIPAKIVTFTEDVLAFTPSPPYAYGTIEFEGGGRMVAEFVDYEPGELAVGTDVRMVFRIKYRDQARGFDHYFWKATPAR